MFERKPLLKDHEKAAKRALLRLADNREWDLYCMAKFSDVIEVRRSGVDDADFDYATRAHIDFLLTDKDSVPQLMIEVDASELAGKAVERAERKDRLAREFQMPLLRMRLNSQDSQEIESQVESETVRLLNQLDRPSQF